MASNLDATPAHRNPDLAEVSIAVVAGLAFAVTIIFIFTIPFTSSLAASRDFVSYWAAGRQLVHHANPYDPAAVSALEHSAGFTYNVVLFMRNPPWALLLALPLGFLGLRVAAVLWTLALLACLLASLHMMHQLYGSPPNRIHWLGFAFTPALICLTMGQTSLFALLGLVLFLRLQRRRPFAAGAALWLCALKPHLFLPFAAALAVWIVYSRGYRVLAGGAATLAISSSIASLVAPQAWADYTGMMRSPTVENEFIPCLADAMRHWLAPGAVWLQYLPALLCCIWAVIYFWRRRAVWEWTTNSGPLILISLLAAPYCWLYDQALAIPALLGGAYSTRFRYFLVALAFLILVADVEISLVRVISPLYLWTAPAWLAWYLLARASARKESLELAAAGA